MRFWRQSAAHFPSHLLIVFLSQNFALRFDVHNFYELALTRNKSIRAVFACAKNAGNPHMMRSALAVLSLLLAALPTAALSQGRAHGFSGLCAFYPAHGNGLTAAHRTLPFGTHVRVTDPTAKRSVVVTINDRGPFGKHRVLDLSPNAARALNMISRGVIFVNAEVL
jgi:hypothetical protein